MIDHLYKAIVMESMIEAVKGRAWKTEMEHGMLRIIESDIVNIP